MNVAVERKGSCVMAKLSGEIDHHAAKSVREAIDSELDRGNVCELVLDFADVSFMDSSGLGVIFGRYNKLLAQGGSLKLKRVPKRIERILRMAGVYTLVDRKESKTERMRTDVSVDNFRSKCNE